MNIDEMKDRIARAEEIQRYTENRCEVLEKENTELKSENAKLKDGIALKDEEMGCIETDFNTFKSQAKEIIKTFLGFAEAFGYSPSMDKFISDTEQFLSEVDK